MTSLAGERLVAVHEIDARVDVRRAALAAATAGCGAITLGLLWDISWHASVGRDSFWTPAHVTIYLGSLLAGLAAAWLVARTTFAGAAHERAAAVRVWGFRAPIGAWVSLWGAAAMLTAAPFDAWWHGTYGLDVGIVTPAHSVLATGMVVVHLGTLLQAAALANRAAGGARRWLEGGLLAVAGVTALLLATLLLESNYPNRQHGAAFYRASALAYPWLLVAVARTGRRWAATTVAAVYTALSLATLWILPLFPAEPGLAPVFNRVDHMWPGIFPLLLLAPAVAVDLVTRRRAAGDALRRGLRMRLQGLLAAPLLGALFVVAFAAVQWPLAAFLLSPRARNPVFAGDEWYFGVTATVEGVHPRLGAWRYQFWETDALAPEAIAWTFLAATASAGLGLVLGRWLRRVQR